MLDFTAGLITGSSHRSDRNVADSAMDARDFRWQPAKKRAISLRATIYALLTISAVVFFCYHIKLRPSIVVLLLFLTILAVAKLGGLMTGLVASLTAAGGFGLLFLPAIGSIARSQSGDRLLLLLFLLSGTIASRLVGDT